MEIGKVYDIEVEATKGKKTTFPAKVIREVKGKKGITHYILIDKNGNRFIKSN